MKRLASLFLVFLCSFLLCGCWDKKEMEDRSYVLTLGIDAFAGEGDQRFQVTFGQAQFTEATGVSGPEKKQPSLSANGKTLAAAIRKADTMSNKQVYLGQLKTVILGKSILEQKDLLTSVLDELERNQDVSLKTIFLATNDKAADCILAIEKEGSGNGLFIYDFYKSTAQDVAVTERLTLEQFLFQLRENDGAVLPRIRLKDEKLRLGGGILLANYEYMGNLDDLEERGLLFLTGKATGAVVEAEAEGITVPLWVYKDRREMTFALEGDRIKCKISPLIYGSIVGGDFAHTDFFTEEQVKKLETQYETIIKQEIENTIELVQSNPETPPLDFAEKFRKYDPKSYEKLGLTHAELREKLYYVVSPKVKIRTMGVVE